MAGKGKYLILLVLGLGPLIWPGMAGAQSASIIDELMNAFSSGGDNLSNLLLSRIFGCQMFDHPGCVAGQEPIMVSMIRIFNILCISLGAALFGWFLATGITQTAHEGKVLGARYSSLWAPVRSLVGLGMLLPVGGSSGYNTIQMGIAMFVKGSTFAASLLWGQAADRIITFQDSYILPSQAFDDTVIEPLWQMEVCASLVSHLLEKVDEGSTQLAVTPARNSCFLGQDGEEVCTVTLKAGGNPKVINTNNLHRADGCGVLTLPRTPSVLTSAGNPSLVPAEANRLAREFRDIHLGAIEAVQDDLRPWARRLTDHVRTAPANQDPGLVAGLAQTITETGLIYSNRLNSGLDGLMKDAGTLGTSDVGKARDRLGLIISGSYSSACRGQGASQPYAQAICNDPGNQGQGWLGAGAWYMHMARFADDGFQVKNARPQFDAEGLDVASRQAWENSPDRKNIVMTRLKGFLFGTSAEEKHLEQEARRMTRELESYWEAAWINAVETGTTIPAELVQGVRQREGGMLAIHWLRNWAGKNLWEWLRPHPDRDPMIGLAGVGHELATIGAAVAGVGLGSQLVALVPAARGFRGLLDAVGDVVLPLGFAVLVIGQALGTIMPVLPSLIWVAAVTGYFLLVAEAIIAVNLWAIMHFRMDGEGLSGPAAQQGYLLVMSLALTPVLMVFGFMLGMGIFKITTTLLNIGFYVVLEGVMQSQNILVWLVGLMLVGILMVIVLFVLAERSFSLTAELPGRVLRWVGGDSQLMSGEADRIRVAGAGAGHQLMQQGQQMTQSIGMNTRGWRKRQGDDKGKKEHEGP